MFPSPLGLGGVVFFEHLLIFVVGVNIQMLAQAMQILLNMAWERSIVSYQLKFTPNLSLYDNFKGLMTICLSI